MARTNSAGAISAGKSTIAPLILRDYLAIPDFVDADQIAAGLSAFNPEGTAFEAGCNQLESIEPAVNCSRWRKPTYRHPRGDIMGQGSIDPNDPIARKLDDNAAFVRLVNQAVSEATEKARKLGFLEKESSQIAQPELIRSK